MIFEGYKYRKPKKKQKQKQKKLEGVNEDLKCLIWTDYK